MTVLFRLKNKRDLLVTEGGVLKCPFDMKVLFDMAPSLSQLRAELSEIEVPDFVHQLAEKQGYLEKARANNLMGCMFSSILSVHNRQAFPLTTGIVTSEQVFDAYTELKRLEYRGGDLQWEDYYLKRDETDHFRKLILGDAG